MKFMYTRGVVPSFARKLTTGILGAVFIISSLVPVASTLIGKVYATPQTIFEAGFENDFASWSSNTGPVSIQSDIAAHEGSKYALFNGATNATLRKIVDVSGYTNLQLSFYYQQHGLDNGDTFTVNSNYSGFSVPHHSIAGAHGNDDINTWTKVTAPVGVPVSGTLDLSFTSAFNTDGDHLLIDSVELTGELETPATPTPTLLAEEFVTVDGSYKGVSVGFNAKDFGAVTDVTVEIERANGGSVVKHGAQGIKDLLSNKTDPVQATAPFVIQEGTFKEADDKDENGHLYWEPAPATWNASTIPVRAIITIRGSNGEEVITNEVFNQGDPSWPTYASLLPTPQTPRLLSLGGYVYRDNTSGCGRHGTGCSDQEERLSDWKIRAYEEDQSGDWQLVQETKTNNNGEYSIRLSSTGGDFHVCEVYPTTGGWTQNKQDWSGTPYHLITANASPNKAEEGPYCSTVTYDGSKNYSNAKYFGNVDSRKPSTEALGPVAGTGTVSGGVYNSPFDVHVRSIDKQSGIIKATANLYGSSGLIRSCVNQTVSPAAPQHDYSCHVDTASLSDGDYYLKINTKDAAELISNTVTWHFTVDKIAPSTPMITAPGARTWHKSSPVVNQWTAAEDASGISHYQIAYNYDDGHVFGGTNTCPGIVITGTSGFIGCRNVDGTKRNHSPQVDEQGGVTIWVRAIDKAGNVSSWSKPVHYYYDHEAPVTDINVSPVVKGRFTVSGSAADNLALNRVYVQLVSRVSSQRCGGTTINLIAKGANANWSQAYDLATLGCPEGNFAAHVSVTDMAGNSSTAGWTDDFRVDEPPVVIGDYFVAEDDQLNVGFTVHKFKDATATKVQLFDENGDLVTENTGDSADITNLLNANGEISSPFYIPNGAETDGYWWFGNPDWKTVKKPAYAVATIYYGDSESVTSSQIPFISPGERGFSYEALLASIPEGSAGSSSQTLGVQITRKDRSGDSDTPSLPSSTNPTTNTPANTQSLGLAAEESTSNNQAQGSKTSEDDENAERVAAATTGSSGYGQQVATDKNTGNKTGFSWLWLLLFIGSLGFGSYYFAYARREK